MGNNKIILTNKSNFELYEQGYRERKKIGQDAWEERTLELKRQIGETITRMPKKRRSAFEKEWEELAEETAEETLPIKELEKILKLANAELGSATDRAGLSKMMLLTDLRDYMRGLRYQFLYVKFPDRVKIKYKNIVEAQLTHLYVAQLGSYYYEPLDNSILDTMADFVMEFVLDTGNVMTTANVLDCIRYTPHFLTEEKIGTQTVRKKIHQTNRDILTISPGGMGEGQDGADLYYDLKTHEFMDGNGLNAKGTLEGEETSYSFWRLFDTNALDADSKVPSIDTKYLSPDIIRQNHDEVRNRLFDYFSRKHKSGKEEEFDYPENMESTFGAWADGESHRVADMLIAISAIISHRPLHGSLFLVGEGRNGKTVFTNLIRTLIGKKRLASISFEDLNDPHSLGALSGAFANISEENRDTRDKSVDTSMFKIAADSGSADIPVFFSQTPLNLVFDMPMFFCYNTIPDWSGRDDSQALNRRTLIIKFTHDFSKQDNRGSEKSFEQETFTPLFMSACVGWVLGAVSACADADSYNWDLGWSKELMESREDMVEAGGSYGANEYVKEFLKNGWTGFTSWRLVLADCNNKIAVAEGKERDIFTGKWKSESGLREAGSFVSMSQLKLAFNKVLDGSSRHHVVNRVNQNTDESLVAYTIAPQYRKVENINVNVIMAPEREVMVDTTDARGYYAGPTKRTLEDIVKDGVPIPRPFPENS